MEPLEAPLPGLLQQTTDNQPWLEELEASFFTMPPMERDVQPDDLEEPEITWKGRSRWPARLFVGACVVLVAASALLVIPVDFFGPAAVRYPIDEVVSDLDTGPDDLPVRKTVRMRRGRRAPKKLSTARAQTRRLAEPVPTPVPGPVVGVSEAAPMPSRGAPLRVDALPAVDLAALESGALL